MNASMIIYLAEVSDSLKNASGILILLMLVSGLVISALSPVILCEMENPPIKKIVIGYTLAVFFIGLVYIIAPSQKTVYMMAAAKLGQEMVESPQTKEISGKVLQLINEKLDDQLKKAPKKND